MGVIKNVTGIATQGRAHSDEFVIEYRIQYGSNGKDWIDYKEIDGSPKLFRGNTDGDYVVSSWDYNTTPKLNLLQLGSITHLQ